MLSYRAVASLVKRLGSPAEPPIYRVVRPFQRFATLEASGGIVLLFCAVAALVWANSAWSDSYARFWDWHLRIGGGDYTLDKPLHFWINDALMAVFFLLVGLEIKRAILVGELSSPRRAALPIMAALGGMVVPAALYVAFNAGNDGARGWGVPMATDIAFSLGVLALLGGRAPLSLKLFVTAFAIVDDIGAVVVIALFYTGSISWIHLGAAAVLLALLAVANWAGIGHAMVYAILGTGVWLAFLTSGIHASVAGVLVAATIPSRVTISQRQFLARGRALLDTFERSRNPADEEHTTVSQRAAVHELEMACMDIQSPLQQMEHELHPWVTYLVVPLFALANAGVILDINIADMLSHRVTLGIVAGLLLGKQAGITLVAWLVVRVGLAVKPPDLTWRHIYGAALLGGIGFTMSLFITGLAFTDPALVSQAKVGILVGSIVSGLTGWLVLGGLGRGRVRHRVRRFPAPADNQL